MVMKSIYNLSSEASVQMKEDQKALFSYYYPREKILT